MVWPALISTSKSQVIQELAKNISLNISRPGADEIASVLINRESLGSTGIQDGIAIPHAKVAGLDRIVVACGRSRQGIEFEAHDNKPTHLFFVLLAPEKATAMHLKILARLSLLLKEADFRSRLMDAQSAEDIYKIIVEEDKRY